MAQNNRGRIIAGGLLAGLVINVVDFAVNGLLLGKAWGEALQALGKPAAFSTSAIVIFIIVGFMFGIGGVWFYAAIRPKYGAGPLTAIRAGVAVWTLGGLLPNLANYPMHFFSDRLLAISAIVGLIEIVGGTVLGAWLYREKEAPVVKAATA